MEEEGTNDDGDNLTNLSRVNDQLNYQRKFLAPDRVVVTIPTIPFQSFDSFLSGTKVKPWEILNLIVSARSFTQWPAKNADNPDDTIIDSRRLMQDHFVFIVAVKMEISKNFHETNSPKFPLSVEASVTHAGNGSSRRRYAIGQASMTSPYVTCDIDDVLVSKRNRRSTSYPKWWTAKFSYINRSPKTKFLVPPRTEERVITNECTVEYEHMDHNKHTTFSAYLLFCFNALFSNVTQTQSRVYDSVSLADFHEGVKSVIMIFHKESNLGDNLIIESWEPRGTPHTANFNITKQDGTVCSSISIEFYAPTETVSSKL